MNLRLSTLIFIVLAIFFAYYYLTNCYTTEKFNVSNNDSNNGSDSDSDEYEYEHEYIGNGSSNINYTQIDDQYNDSGNGVTFIDVGDGSDNYEYNIGDSTPIY